MERKGRVLKERNKSISWRILAHKFNRMVGLGVAEQWCCDGRSTVVSMMKGIRWFVLELSSMLENVRSIWTSPMSPNLGFRWALHPYQYIQIVLPIVVEVYAECICRSKSSKRMTWSSGPEYPTMTNRDTICTWSVWDTICHLRYLELIGLTLLLSVRQQCYICHMPWNARGVRVFGVVCVRWNR